MASWLDFLGVTSPSIPGATPDQTAQYQQIQKAAAGQSVLPALFALGIGALSHPHRYGVGGAALAGLRDAGIAYSNSYNNKVNTALQMAKDVQAQKKADLAEKREEDKALNDARRTDAYVDQVGINKQKAAKDLPVGRDVFAPYREEWAKQGIVAPDSDTTSRMSEAQIVDWSSRALPTQLHQKVMEDIARGNEEIHAAEANANNNAISSTPIQVTNPDGTPGYAVLQHNKKGQISTIKLPGVAPLKGAANTADPTARALKYQSGINSAAKTSAINAGNKAVADSGVMPGTPQATAIYQAAYQKAFSDKVQKLKDAYSLDDNFRPKSKTDTTTSAATTTEKTATPELPDGAIATTKMPNGFYHKNGRAYVVKDGFVFPG